MADPEIQDAVVRHARADMANLQQPAAEPPGREAPEPARQGPSFGAQFDAMFREAVKDIRQTMNESYFGQGEHAAEMGSPMNPTPQITTDELRGTGQGQAQNQAQGYDQLLDAQAARGSVYGREQDQGVER
ncbi:hypothetical protein [Singulisphaera sp. PoT]|uniref:hypothetical protein n=1 Tax=Singulisphaera sp. PoT TaxID=3411797 RepID=UPI003BF5E793